MRIKINLDHITDEEVDIILEIIKHHMILETIKHQETTDRDEPAMYRYDNLESYITQSGDIEIKRWEYDK